MIKENNAMKNKKKILVLSLIVAMLAIAVVGGSLAWFTAEDEATNTFTIGSVEIIQNEKQRVIDANGNKTNDYEDFEDDKVLLPIGDPSDLGNDPNFVDKFVSVTSTGNNEAYVRTHIAMPTALKDVLVLDYLDTYIAADITEGKWTLTATTENVTVDGIVYTVYSYTYGSALGKDETTPNLLEGVYIKAETDMNIYRKDATDPEKITEAYFVWNGQEITALNVATLQIDVLVATQAVQAQGFDGAMDALDNAFGANSIPTFTVE